jgi:hypothetical protein
MKSIKRRQLGQLALASAATAILPNFVSRAIAQNPTLPIYGIRLVNSSRTINFATFDVSTRQILANKNLPGAEAGDFTVLKSGSSNNTEVKERITGFTALSEDRFLVSTVLSSRNGAINRLMVTGTSSQSIRVTGLGSTETIESLVKMNDDSIVGLISLNQGTPPFDLVRVDISSGRVERMKLDSSLLSNNYRYGNLALAPDGSIYATMLGRRTTTLVKLDLYTKKVTPVSELFCDDMPLTSDVRSLSFSRSGQLFALASCHLNQASSLLSVNLKTGKMNFLTKLSLDKISFS